MQALRFSCIVALTTTFFSTGCGDSGSTSSSGSTGSSGGTCTPGDGCPTVKSDCLGLVDNTSASPFALRFSHLTISSPDVLKGPIVKNLLDGGVSLNLPKCMSATKPPNPFFPPTALGTFSWILQFDKSGMLTTGGAKPQMDPTQGYCFVNEMIQGFQIKPLVVSAPIGPDGKFSVAMPEDVAVPVYNDINATKVILLPLRQVTLSGTLSTDHNCIGKLNPMLDPNNNCLPDSMTPQFIDAGSLSGFASLEDADKVSVDQLGGKSLCAILTNDASCATACTGTPAKCTRDMSGQIIFKGDWCAATNSAATTTCHDAVHLVATFAASSVAMKTTCP